ncbi:MAG: AmmeMemoRadiSam system radical SAM enzyme [Deltaproteobacteria bacterium]|nr:MAG: AmmeMemoRadiSam system radical SAM enzyme [Deltaproteobacteria bacterium]
MQPARYWQAEAEGMVRCLLCPHQCLIKPGARGICGVRQNRDGQLFSLNYARAIAVHDDPIEKKPLFHVLPGSSSLSVATAGCNFRCRHCQNHEISQAPQRLGQIPGSLLPAEQVVEIARERGTATISFTYTEPTIFMEWAQDIAAGAGRHGIRCLSISNGYTAARPLRDLAPNLAAANVDLKSFSDEFYRKICGGRLQPVLDTISLMHELGIWVEVTTLLIPGLNDDPEQLQRLAAFLVEVDPAIPWHLSRFHPDNDMLDRHPTPLATIEQARQIGLEAGLRFVYSGNVWGDQGENTRCPACRELLIERVGFSVRRNRLREGRCPDCGEVIEGLWQ